MPKSSIFPLPSISEILASPMIKPLVDHLHPSTVLTTTKSVLDELRAEMKLVAAEKRMPDITELVQRIITRLNEHDRVVERPIVNATGIIFHPEFGDPPLSIDVLEQMLAASDRGIGATCTEPLKETGIPHFPYSYDSVVLMLRELTGFEDALIFDNVILAKQLVISTFCGEKEAVLARCESYETEQGERLIDLMKLLGTGIIEVGAANRVRIEDYETAINEGDPGLIYMASRAYANCKFGLDVSASQQFESGKFDLHYDAVNPNSNEALKEKKEEKTTPTVQSLVVQLCTVVKRDDIPVLLDLQLASFRDLTPFGLKAIPTVSRLAQSGADMVLFSGGGVIGGPGCGIIVGRKTAIDRIRNHPLFRAFSPSPMVLAGQHAVLSLYLLKKQLGETRIPVMQLIGTTLDNLRNRAARMTPQIAASEAVDEAFYTVGSVPLLAEGGPLNLPTCKILMNPNKIAAHDFASKLLSTDPGIIVSIISPHSTKTCIPSVKTTTPEKNDDEWFRPGLPADGSNPFGVTDDWVEIDLRSVQAKYDLSIIEAIQTL